jgi:type IV secretion system protein VirB10
MRTCLLLLAAPFFCAAAQIPQGSHALLEMMNTVSTRTARTGDYVYMRTATPIVDGGQIVVPAGAYVQGVVTESKRSGRVKGQAELAIRVETLTIGGRVIRVAPALSSVDSEGTDQKVKDENKVGQGGSEGADAARIATTAGTGAALGAVVDRSWKGAGIGAGAGTAVGAATVLLSRGREVELRKGTTVDVVFPRAVSLD